MSRSLSICPECDKEWPDDCLENELGICRVCLLEMKRKADAYPKLMELAKRMEEANHSPNDSFRAYKLLKELGELE